MTMPVLTPIRNRLMLRDRSPILWDLLLRPYTLQPIRIHSNLGHLTPGQGRHVPTPWFRVQGLRQAQRSLPPRLGALAR